jgi:crossover junction endodeoxyribonuclease RusA
VKRQTFYLPIPPSVNNLFFNSKRGRVKTPKYTAWLAEAGWKLNFQRAKPMQGQALVYISICRPNMRSDLDNRTKALLDLIVSQQIIRDDRDIVHLSSKWVGKQHIDFHGEAADVLLKIATF